MCPGQSTHQEWHDPNIQGVDIPLLDKEHLSRCTLWIYKLVPPMRYVVVILGLIGCLVDYVVRYGLSVAIVAMVNTTKAANRSIPVSSGVCPVAINTTDDHGDDLAGESDFNWTIEQQGIILGTFFWGYFITKTTGGHISEVVGARQTMAVTLGLSGLLCVLCPTAAHFHPMALAAIRFLMGLVQGPSFSALYTVIAAWAPPNELATMVTIAFSGMSVGSLLVMGLSGWVIETLGWEWVFYGAGCLTLLWVPLWLAFVPNHPSQHLCMSDKERQLLSQNCFIKPKRHVPWSQVLRCYKFLPCILAEFASSWVGNQTTTEGPTFLKTQIGMDMSMVGKVLMAGQSCSWLGAFVFGRLSDTLIQRDILSKLNTRRLLHLIGMTLVVSGLWGIVVAGCNQVAVSVLMVIVMTGTATTLCTFTLAPMDLAPNYAGTMSGLLGLGNVSGFLAPIVTAQIITATGDWSTSLMLSGGIYLVTGAIYLATITTEVQEWNDYQEIDGDTQEFNV